MQLKEFIRLHTLYCNLISVDLSLIKIDIVDFNLKKTMHVKINFLFILTKLTVRPV